MTSLKYSPEKAEKCRVAEEIITKLKRYEDETTNHRMNVQFPEPALLLKLCKNIYTVTQNLVHRTISFMLWLVGVFVYHEPHPDWELLFESDDHFKVGLYFNRKQWQMLLVFKGTSTVTDVKSVFNNVLLNIPDADETMSALFTLGEELRTFMSSFKRMPHLIVTGHSLGGFYAQVLTYTIANMHVHEGKACKSESPHQGVYPHTVVFDSPSSFKAIGEICGENPRTVASIWMDVTNYIIEPNLINKSTYQGCHIGLLLQADVEDVRWSWEKCTLFYSHRLEHFSKANFQHLQKVVNILRGCSIQYESSTKFCFEFSMEEWDSLKFVKILLSDVARAEGLPEFCISHTSVKISESSDNSSACSTFVPLARRIIAKYWKQLSLKALQYKEISKSFDFYLEAKLDGYNQAFMGYTLAETHVNRISNLQNGGRVTTRGGEPEQLMLARLLSNSISNFHAVRSEDLVSTKYQQLPEFATLLVVVTENEEVEPLTDAWPGKVLYLCEPGQVPGNVQNKHCFRLPITINDLSSDSQEALRKLNVQYLGNEVSVDEVFAEMLDDESTSILDILNFKCDVPQELKVTHEAKISAADGDGTLVNVQQLAETLTEKFGDKKPQLIKSGPGTGKTWLLRRLREELQRRNDSYWVVELDLLRMHQQQLRYSIEDEKTLDSMLQSNLGTSVESLHKKLFREKLRAGNVILLIDSYDHIKSVKERDAVTFFKELNAQELNFVVTCETGLQDMLENWIVYDLKTLEEIDQEIYFANRCNEVASHDENPQTNELLDALRTRHAKGEDFTGNIRNLNALADLCPRAQQTQELTDFGEALSSLPGLPE